MSVQYALPYVALTDCHVYIAAEGEPTVSFVPALPLVFVKYKAKGLLTSSPQGLHMAYRS